MHWYQLAAQAGNRKAMHNLAVAYASGTGTAKNMPEAARWFSKAAALGLADSNSTWRCSTSEAWACRRACSTPTNGTRSPLPAATRNRKRASTRLTTQISADDRAAAQHAADGFHPGALDPRANVAPQMADLAG